MSAACVSFAFGRVVAGHLLEEGDEVSVAGCRDLPLDAIAKMCASSSYPRHGSP